MVQGGNLNSYQTEHFIPAADLSSRVPFAISVGNHEYGGDGDISNFLAHFVQDDNLYKNISLPEGENYFSLRCGRSVFMMLNSVINGETQLNWLETTTATAQNDNSVDWVFAFAHHPQHCEQMPGDMNSWILEQALPTMDKYDKAALYGCGHSHLYHRGALENEDITIILSGGGGAGLQRWHGDPAQRDYPDIQKTLVDWHWVLVDIDLDNKSLTGSMYSLGHTDRPRDNELLDTFYRKLNASPPDQPAGLSSQDSVKLPFTLDAGAYSGAEPLNSSRFQLSAVKGDYSNPLIDIKRDIENVYLDSGSPDWEPLDQNEGIDLSKLTITTENIQMPGLYYWRVAYRDQNLQWSEWSEEQTLNVHFAYNPDLARNKALSFDGEDSYISVTNDLNNALLPVKDITIETWVKLHEHETWGGYIGAFQDNGAYEKGWVLGNFDDKFSFALSSTGTGDSDGLLTYLESSGTLQHNHWYHIAGTYDGSTMNIYVNGQLTGSSTDQSGNIYYDMSSFFSIGAYHDENEFFVLNGEMDEIRLWNTALAEETLQAWMHQEINDSHPQYTNLISDWNCNNLSGSMLPDYKDNNNGYLQNMKITDLINSTAPLGLVSAFVETQTATEAGAEGTVISARITSIPNSSNYLGIYQSGVNDGSSVSHEIFPEGIKYRSNIFWGIQEYGAVTADIAMQYEQITGIAHPDSLRLLSRNNAAVDWEDVTVEFSHDMDNKIFYKIGETVFDAEYALGWQSEITDVDQESANLKPDEFRLFQNYPNPFNAVTSIRYAIKNNGHVYIAVYNIRGQIIATLVDYEQAAGTYSVNWDASELSSGIYFYQLKTEGFSEVKKLMLMK